MPETGKTERKMRPIPLRFGESRDESYRRDLKGKTSLKNHAAMSCSSAWTPPPEERRIGMESSRTDGPAARLCRLVNKDTRKAYLLGKVAEN